MSNSKPICDRVVITYGTFDLLHYGHVRLLERAKALGGRLIVGVSSDDFNKIKGKTCVYPYQERKVIVEALRSVSLVIPERTWAQKIEDIRKYKVDVFVMGDDWRGKFDDLCEFCEVVYLTRTDGISTTGIKGRVRSSSESK